LPQFCGEIEVEVADVEFRDEFVTLARAEAIGAETFEDVLVEICDEAVETAAHGGLVNVELACELGEGALIQIVGREEEAVFGSELAEALVERDDESRIGGGGAWFGRRGEGGAGFDLLFKAYGF